MRIFRTKRRRSERDPGAVVLRVLAFVTFLPIVLLSLYLIPLIYFPSTISSLIAPHSSEVEIIGFFNENRDDFIALGEMLREKDELFQYLYDERDTHCIPDLRGLGKADHPCRDYFTDEEWEFLRSFVKKYKPTEIYRQPARLVKIDFNTRIGSVVLHCLPYDSQGIYWEKINDIKQDRFTDKFFELGDGWYCAVIRRS